MVINKNTPNVAGYKIHSSNGEQIMGIASFDTETGEAEMMVIPDAKMLAEVLPDGSKRHVVKGSKLEIKRVKLEGAYATFRGKRV